MVQPTSPLEDRTCIQPFDEQVCMYVCVSIHVKNHGGELGCRVQASPAVSTLPYHHIHFNQRKTSTHLRSLRWQISWNRKNDEGVRGDKADSARSAAASASTSALIPLPACAGGASFGTNPRRRSCASSSSNLTAMADRHACETLCVLCAIRGHNHSAAPRPKVTLYLDELAWTLAYAQAHSAHTQTYTPRPTPWGQRSAKRRYRRCG